MLQTLAIVVGIAAVFTGAAAAWGSYWMLYAGVLLALAALAIQSQAVSGRTETETPVPPAASGGSDRKEPPTEACTSVTDEDRLPQFEIITPAALDVTSVAQALYRSSLSAGPVVRVSIWHSDGASGDPVRIAGVGDPKDRAFADRAGIGPALTEGTSVLEAMTVGSGTADAMSYWRYTVPVIFAEIRGVAAIDFEGVEPDLQLLNRITAAFRLPLAAALSLSSARKESDAATALLESASDLSRVLDSEQVVSRTLKRALELTGAKTGSIMLYDEDGATLRIVDSVGLPAEVVRGTAVRPGDGIAGWVALSGQPLVVEDLPGRTSPARSRGVRSAVSVPISDDKGVLGVLNIGTGAYPSSFTSTDLTALEGLANHSATALRNARALASAADIYFDTLRALALALETKDPYALGGTDRVLAYSKRLGAAMGLAPEEAQALEIAAMLHDIGMSSTGEAATVSSRPLSTVERGMLKMHPVIGAEILEQAPALREVVPIVYHHHEHYDGSGYVGGLRGEAIPLGARILAVADAYVAMTSDRPHRKAMSQEEALRELVDNAGTQFDPVVVDTLVSIETSDRHRVRGSS